MAKNIIDQLIKEPKDVKKINNLLNQDEREKIYNFMKEEIYGNELIELNNLELFLCLSRERYKNTIKEYKKEYNENSNSNGILIIPREQKLKYKNKYYILINIDEIMRNFDGLIGVILVHELIHYYDYAININRFDGDLNKDEQSYFIFQLLSEIRAVFYMLKYLYAISEDNEKIKGVIKGLDDRIKNSTEEKYDKEHVYFKAQCIGCLKFCKDFLFKKEAFKCVDYQELENYLLKDDKYRLLKDFLYFTCDNIDILIKFNKEIGFDNLDESHEEEVRSFIYSKIK